ncbi:hypothetical protein [Rhizobium sp. OAE497]|uniref:hypothetical protein n=1 Tax=Rhizobium sp. OAE497 TaxID=2663796 RepID=UPI0018F4E204
MNIDAMKYSEINNFEEIINMASAVVQAEDGDVSMNFTIQVKFSTDLLRAPQLQDVSDLAMSWQAVKPPEELHFSHGQFIGENGIDYIITELENKPDSNRALMSLISQQHLLESGDNPIPSFMILQFSRSGDTLYATTYFRALEVSKFLRINIEEIRQVCERIRKIELDLKEVRLTIFAFRAYHNPSINTLQVPQLDRLGEARIVKKLEKAPWEFASLIKDKKKHSTVVTWHAFEALAKILEDKILSEDIPAHPNKARVISLLRKAIDQSQKLAEVRRKSSHHDDIQKLVAELATTLDKLVLEFEKWK